MLILILIGLCAALAWVAQRYARLRRGVGLLANAIAQRSPFLRDDPTLIGLHPAWQRLVEQTGEMVREVAQLRSQGAGRLNQLETTLGNLQEGVLIVDRDNYVLLANPAIGRIFPAAREVAGKRVESILHSTEFLGLLDTIRVAGKSSAREIEFVEQGRSIWIEVTGAPVPDTDDQNGPWCVFVLHDISRQKELERVRKEFVANVSHELKTPISMIRGYAETLADDEGSLGAKERVDFAQTIVRHSDRLAATVDDLLTLSRLESGGSVLQPVVQDMVPVLDEVAEEFRARFEATGHRLDYRRPEPLIVAIDAPRLVQVLGNLLENAQKYTPAGSRIELGAGIDSPAHGIALWVEDDGPGIPAADLPRIFERFYRVEKGRSREKGGTGLGLSIVKHIVHLHGGRVSADSVVGQGTRIAISLPVATNVAASHAIPARTLE